MKIFDCEELSNLVKKVVNEKLIDECADTFAEKVYSSSSLRFLSYDEIIEVCAVLDVYTDICNISAYKKCNTLYGFMISVYDREDFLAIAGEVFFVEDYDPSDYTFKAIFEDEHDEDGDWYPIFLAREFWEFCDKFINENKNESEENMNNENTKTKEETFSIQDIYKIVTDSEGFEKIIEGMEDIGFTDETIYEVILNLVKRLD
jgi:hypothetical protein